MEELIKEAEKLYKNIDDIQLMWVKSTKDSYEEGKIFAIGLMHATMNSVSQFLKCLIDRKDNIVDLGEVWHDGNCVPEEGKQIFVVTKSGFCYAGFYRHFNGLLVNGCLLLGVDIAKYIYVEDLFPKGGE